MEQCRVITKKGTQCSRKAKEGCAGFCKQHFNKPVEEGSRLLPAVWKVSTVGAGVISTATGVIKIIEFVVKYWESLPFGKVDHGAEYRWLESKLPSPRFGMHRSGHRPFNKGVDWKTAKFVYEECERVLEKARADSPENVSVNPEIISSIEDNFSAWFTGLQQPFKEAVYEYLEQGAEHVPEEVVNT